jgi:cytochrome d ubiquinol oxidase subunit II
MLNFAPYIDLPLVWGGLIATAICLYVLLDSFLVAV